MGRQHSSVTLNASRFLICSLAGFSAFCLQCSYGTVPSMAACVQGQQILA